ncbi:glycosyltransferase family 2 protein [Brevibacillus ruminantium]|uniref:Glycosyltransferase family 2 protein n=1 Tax=Brevibacillus ruminantium TaxID=2950604 RepID=A0ABY4WMQ6_9BACL|nr:glycosyltransferase family 2 protein [Brevibacillus ruminantium]USG68435.1 glycosyltransferase family 2 protein [Brevibacillus ruminantium]
MSTPLFTVVIPTYNRAEYIRKAIDSVMNQSCKDWKLLIIDDASTDKTRNKVDRYLFHPHIQYYCMEQNSGISAVMNRALSLVDTPYLIQLDSDDWLPKKALAILKKSIKKDKRRKISLFYGNIKVWRIQKGKYVRPFLIKHRQFHTKYQFLTYNYWMVAPRCYLVSALRNVGGWDTTDKYQGRIMEDRRIILRLIERYPVKWINKKLYNRTKHKGQLTDNKMKQKRNELRRQTFDYYLKRWGNEYKAVYVYQNGYLIIKKLKKRGRRKQ